MGCATIYPSEGFELDLKNKGNPLVAHLGPLKPLAMRAWQRTAALIGRSPRVAKIQGEGFLTDHADAHRQFVQGIHRTGRVPPERLLRTRIWR
jgi:hypothetical protein